tara:strand:- start:1027 stop:1566 length:540 start_codon:yes stop_codon:yes gene_type:complete
MEKLVLTQTKLDIGELKDIDNNILKEHCLKYKNIINRERGNDVTDTLSEDSDIPTHPELEKMLNGVNKQYFLKYKKNLKLEEFWGHIHDKNQSTTLHHHATVNNLDNSPHISGVYYVNVPENAGVIVFQYPTNQFLNKRYWVQPKEGLFILFPSTLEHFVTRNKNKKERISISFNFKLI